MKDETYAFISDVKEKGSIGRSARNRKTHTGKGGRVRLPSDNLSKKELMKMSGECKSYRLNEPMSWKEFMSMPDDIKVTYIKLLRQKFNVPDKNLAEMFSINKDYICRTFKKLGLQRNVHTSHPKWDKEGFWAWVNGVDKLPTPVPEEPNEAIVIEEVTQEDMEDIEQMMPGVKNLHIKAEAVEEPEAFVEEDLPWNEQDPIPMSEFEPYTATPCNGSMSFKNCPADQALNTLKQLLGDTKVSISIMWKVEEGDEDGKN